ncbi:hypothetical protein [Asticcacaulis sp. EMRT-3]|uniref:hypothetical protein n=1 Tax=Asticcacaulis sp. EMRT-3 TaxID=3040349 RepID=UPI0024AF3142|nr:hypothetical protein [Asticcacaulis sp. EMRT-3]MDI7774008.1 hypothetical protein [Asticcacaulis sp. EMRT-3]
MKSEILKKIATGVAILFLSIAFYVIFPNKGFIIFAFCGAFYVSVPLLMNYSRSILFWFAAIVLAIIHAYIISICNFIQPPRIMLYFMMTVIPIDAFVIYYLLLWSMRLLHVSPANKNNKS